MFHFSKGNVVADGHKHWIVTVTLFAAHRPDKGAFNGALENFIVPVGLSHHKR
jgi:hypothetical protein